jgi:aminopeptidase N
VLFLQSCLSARDLHKYVNKNEAKTNQIVLNDLEITPKRTDNFRTTPVKSIDILHMDLEVKFNWGKHQCIGKEQILLKPYFYTTDSIVLDAKNMIFNSINVTDINTNPIQHLVNYDKKRLVVKLEKTLTSKDSIFLSISYIASPDDVEKGGSLAIKDNKGLYFINTDNKEPNKPIQLWTQGETEANSCWFPTIDRPNEKFTSTLSITVNKDMTTLSNGELVNSVENENSRTDVWDNKLAMPAYLTMMAIGNFTITHDTWNKKDVDYYLEKDYQSFAKNIFSNTNSMLQFYSDKLGVNYPWNKYSQVVVRDYVSGAMENTSATLHGEFVQKNNRELLDGDNEGIVSHELFHQWFGDLVTCESWSHLVLNEGFATYGELLWVEHKSGKDAALKKGYNALNKYLNYVSKSPDEAIINYNYKNQEDLFNAITYQKGSRVLHLLRNKVGDEAFFLSLKNYLNNHAYDNAEIDDLRNEFEKVTGTDLRPFFQQWFMRGGHPTIDIRYDYIDSLGLLAVTVEQTQTSQVGLFNFPLTFEVTQGQKTRNYSFDISKKKEIFYVKKIDEELADRVDVNVDPDGIFIGEIKDHKPFINHILTYYRANNYLDKVRCLKELSHLQNQNDSVRNTLLSAINDADEDIREKVLDWIDWKNTANLTNTVEFLTNQARSDVSAPVRARVCSILGDTKNPLHLNLYSDLINDSSYTVAGEALLAMNKLIPDEAYRQCKRLEKDAKGRLFSALGEIYAQSGTIDDTMFFTTNLMKISKGKRADLIKKHTDLLFKLQKEELLKTHCNMLFDRAIEDENSSVRYQALQSSYAIKTRFENLLSASKDDIQKNEYKDYVAYLSQRILDIASLEKDNSVLSQLKINGILPGDFRTHTTEE